MADNTEIEVGVGGDTLATDDIAGVKFQRSKIAFGDTELDVKTVSSTDKLPGAAVGTVASGEVDMDNPRKIGGKALSSNPTVGDLDRVDMNFDLNGRTRLAIEDSGKIIIGTNNIGDVDIASLPGTAEADIGAIKTGSDAFAGAVSGSEMQADVVTLPGNVEPDLASIAASLVLLGGTVSAGAVQIDTQLNLMFAATAASLTVKLATDSIFDGTVLTMPVFGSLNIPSATSAGLIPAVSGKSIRVLGFMVVPDSDGTFKWVNSTDDLTGAFDIMANTPFSVPFSPAGWFESGINEPLNALTTTAAIAGFFLFAFVG